MSEIAGRWAELAPDARLAEVLDTADGPYAYADLVGSGTADDKRNWSNRFADGCAAMVAGMVRVDIRKYAALGDLSVYPELQGPAERPVLLGEGSRKRIDVAVVHRLGGLRVDISLKGLNFVDKAGGQYDKNLTGRTYELEDELREVRRLQPSSFVFALYWLPLAAATDKGAGESSLARTVLHLRRRVHIGPPGVARAADRLDGAAVALYVPVPITLSSGERVQRGAVRCLDVFTEPPRRGRPKLGTTASVEEQVARWVRVYVDASGVAKPDWAAPEEP